jgi:hypothetical protein
MTRANSIDATPVANDRAAIRDILLAFYTPAEAFEFLFAPQTQFAGRSAMEAIAVGETHHVLTVLRQLNDGVHL